MKQKTETNRVEVGGAGIGEVSDAMISKRAGQIARSDGRDEANALDLEQARADLMGSVDSNDDLAEEERAGDGAPAGGAGKQAPRLELEDEANFAEIEIEEGIAEAEFDTRRQSGDSDDREP